MALPSEGFSSPDATHHACTADRREMTNIDPAPCQSLTVRPSPPRTS